MGSGEFGSNGSVVWNVQHGPRGGPTGPALEPGGGQPGPNRVKVGPNGAEPHVRGKDEVTPDEFIVTLRFQSAAAANDAWAAHKTVDVPGRGVLISLVVPRTDPLRPNRNADPPLEVQVDW